MRLFVFFLIQFLFVGLAMSQNPSGNATVYVVRVKNFHHQENNLIGIDMDDRITDTRGFHVFIDSIMVCTLNHLKFSKQIVSPGKHNFSARLNSKSYSEKYNSLEIDLDSGKVYYINIVPTKDVEIPIKCMKIGDLLGSKLIQDLEEDKSCMPSQNTKQ